MWVTGKRERGFEMTAIIGIDIGGANTKVASADGKITEIHYIPLWKDTALPRLL